MHPSITTHTTHSIALYLPDMIDRASASRTRLWVWTASATRADSPIHHGDATDTRTVGMVPHDGTESGLGAMGAQALWVPRIDVPCLSFAEDARQGLPHYPSTPVYKPPSHAVYLQQTFSHFTSSKLLLYPSPFSLLTLPSVARLYRQPPLTMRVALLVLAFAAVFVLASPDMDKKKKKSKAPKPAAADPAPEAVTDAPSDDAAA
ncbi:hypothetical protein EYR38_008328 [Pleurotus pulmonarius]|nr:hypothetical protein EYR38_008328 [Pleurotus pulmonarius]